MLANPSFSYNNLHGILEVLNQRFLNLPNRSY